MIKTTVHRVLVPVTLDEQGISAINHAREIHDKFQTNITFLYVIPDESILTEWFRPVTKQTNLLHERKRFKAFITEQFGGEFPRYIRLKVRHGSITKCVVRLLRHLRYDLVIFNKKLEQNPRSQSAWETGIKLVVGEALCPVLTYDGGNTPLNIKNIMLPLDIVQPHRLKVAWVSRLAKAWGAKVHVVSVLTANIAEEDSTIFRKMNDVRLSLEERGIAVETTLLREDSGTKLCNIMRDFINEQKPDLTLIMTHRETIFDFNYIGRLASEVILNTEPPVFCITPKKETLITSIL